MPPENQPLLTATLAASPLPTGTAGDPVALWHDFLDALSDALVVLDPESRVRYANAAALSHWHCEPALPLATLQPRLDDELLEWVYAVLDGRADADVAPLPGLTLSPLSNQRWVLKLPLPSFAGDPRLPPRGQPLAELQRLYWRSPFPAVLQDDAYLIVDVNEAFVDYIGVPRADLLGLDPLALVPAEDLDLWEATREQLAYDHETTELPPLVERRLIDGQGRERWYRGARRNAVAPDGRLLRLTVMQDCTAEHAARARAERSLRELDQWFELSPVGMLAFDGAGLVLRSNAVFEALVGRVPVLLGEAPSALRDLLGWLGPGSLDGLQPGGDALERRGWMAAPRGATRHLRARVRCTDAGGGAEPRYIAVVEDLSAEQALDLAEARLGALVDAAGVEVAVHDVAREQILADSLPAFDRLQAALRAGEAAQARYAVRHPQLGTRWLLTRIEPREGSAASVVTLDVTEQERNRSRSEELLRELSSILESSTAGIAYLRGNMLVRCNRRFERMLGIAAGAVAGCSVRELFAAQPQARLVVDEAEQALADAGLYETEVEILLPERPPQWIALSARRIGPVGPEQEVVAVLSDISRLKRQQGELERLAGERERTEAAMAQQAELTRAILDSVFVGIVTVGPQGIEWMNRSARRMFGGDLADFHHQPLACVATAEAQHPFRRAPAQLAAPALPIEPSGASFECRVQARDGRAFWVVGNAVATGDAEQPQLTYALLDIDRRREAEARSLQAQASLQRVIEMSPVAITLFDAGSGALRQVNAVAAEVIGLPAEQIVGRRPEELPLPVEGRLIVDDLRAALADGREGEVTRREYRFERDGQTQVWDARYLPLAQPGQPPDAVLQVASNVTEQRTAEAARLQAEIAQREMLVKEVHHRIKNNLQGVAGLLTQIAQRQPDVAPAIQEAVGQVQAIAQVYGLQVGGRGPLRLASLVEAIAAGLSRGSGRTIAVRLPDEPAGAPQWALPEAEAIPVALTLNELLGNALKHGADGAVDCTLVNGADDVRIEIRNDGRLPEGFSLERVGAGVFGLGLVRALLPRRSASLALTGEGGRVLASVTLRPPGLTRLGVPA